MRFTERELTLALEGPGSAQCEVPASLWLTSQVGDAVVVPTSGLGSVMCRRARRVPPRSSP